MTFEQQIKDIAQAAARQISSQIEERIAGLATEVSQAASADRVSVVRELRLAAEAEVAKRSQEAVAAAQSDHARRLEEAVSLARQESGRRLDEALAAARADQSRRIDEAVAAARAEAARARDAALNALRADLTREHAADLAAARADVNAQIEAALAETRADASRRTADAVARAREDADRSMIHALDAARREAVATAEEVLLGARVAERQGVLALVESLRDAVLRIDAAQSLTDVLDAMAESAGRQAPRVAVFILRGSRLTGWRHSGFGADVDPSRIEVAVDQPGLLTVALRSGRAVATSDSPADDPSLVTPFGPLPADSAGLAVPIRIGGETVAIVYADDAVPGRAVPSAFPEAIELLACHAARCLEVLTFTRAAAQAPPARPQSRLTQTLTGAPASRGPGPGSAASPLPGAAAAAAEAPPGPRYAPTTRSFQASGDEDDDAARRYARLLVSEIKLYHETAVAEGRRQRNLLARLRPEIERAQRLYEERVPVQIRLKSDFFGQELVRTLASGDPSLLGAR